MKKQYLECGKIVSTHGIKGELRVHPWCDSPEFLCNFQTLYLQKGETVLTVERCRPNKNMILLKLKGVDTLDDAVTFRGKVLYINRDDASDDGGVFIQDLIGMEVLDADRDISWGVLKDVISTGANDVYVIEDSDKKQRLVPAIKDVIISTDIEQGLMRIRPLKGLFDDAD